MGQAWVGVFRLVGQTLKHARQRRKHPCAVGARCGRLILALGCHLPAVSVGSFLFRALLCLVFSRVVACRKIRADSAYNAFAVQPDTGPK